MRCISWQRLPLRMVRQANPRPRPRYGRELASDRVWSSPKLHQNASDLMRQFLFGATRRTLRIYSQAIGDLTRAVEGLKEAMADQAPVMSRLAWSWIELDAPISGAAIQTLDVRFLHAGIMHGTRDRPTYNRPRFTSENDAGTPVVFSHIPVVWTGRGSKRASLKIRTAPSI